MAYDPTRHAGDTRLPPGPWVLASANAHKAEELTALLGGRVTLRSLGEAVPGLPAGDLPEIGRTLAANALQKARYVLEHLEAQGQGAPVLADDSGLEVDALGGAPGVDTAHYSGSRDAGANMALLLHNLSQAGAQEPVRRQAQFRTVLVIVWPGGPAEGVTFEGIVRGTIAPSPAGTGGFGYDPIFIPDTGAGTSLGRTFAEHTPEEKNRMSHRARAAAALLAALQG